MITKLDMGIRDHKVDDETIESYLEIFRTNDDGSVHSRVAVRRCEFERFVEQLREVGRTFVGAEEIARLLPRDETARAQEVAGVAKRRK